MKTNYNYTIFINYFIFSLTKNIPILTKFKNFNINILINICLIHIFLGKSIHIINFDFVHSFFSPKYHGN